MAFHQLKTGDADLDRVQGNVATAFDEVNNTDDHAISVVAVSSNYTVKGTEDVLALTSGTVIVTLQPPKKQTRKLIVTRQGGQATIQTGDNSFKVDFMGPPQQAVNIIPRPDGSGYWVY